jgi:formylglycine-generating enzyme required for sulfatase activity
MDATQQQRQGVTTGQMSPDSLTGARQQQSWQQSQQNLSHGQQPFQSSAPSIPIPEPKKFPVILIVLLAVVLLGSAVGAYFLFFSGKTATDTSANKGKPDTQPTPTPIKADLVEIPGGTFQMGRSGGTLIEGPPHAVTVQPFAMDRTEVTNTEYELFVRETGRKPPSHWFNNKPLAGQEQWPVNNVSYDDAVAFAAWRSKRDKVNYRLPTEEEWEFAARNGEQADLYPWGSSWETGRSVVEAASPQPVGSLPAGKNRWGVMDLIGNVWEWTQSKASYYPGSSNIVPVEERTMMVYRGGSYATKMSETPATGTVRNWQKPTTAHPTLGFRLVRGNP